MAEQQTIGQAAGRGGGSGRLQTGLLACFWALLAAVALWRTLLAVSVTLQATLPEMLGAAVVQWRRLDEMAAWLAMTLLVLGGDGGIRARTLRQERLGVMLSIALALGACLTGASIVADQGGWGGGAALGLAGLVILMLCAIYVSGREVQAIRAALRGAGVTILDLWRFAAAQWGLLMAVALIFLAITVSHAERLGNETIRHLTFLVAAAGVMPAAMMAAGITWWDQVLRAGPEADRAAARPRVRAWLVAFALSTVAGVLLVMRATWPAIPGAALALAAITLYLLGFPAAFWRGIGGKIVLAAWVFLALGLGALMLERLYTMSGQPMSRFYSSAWRGLWMDALSLFSLGMGALAWERLAVSQRLGIRRLILLAAALLSAGALLTAGIYLTAAALPGDGRVTAMRWLVLGAAVNLIGWIAAGAALLAARRSGVRS